MFFLSYLVLAPKLRTDGLPILGTAGLQQANPKQCFQHVNSTNNRIPTSTAQSRLEQCIPTPSRSRSDRTYQSFWLNPFFGSYKLKSLGFGQIMSKHVKSRCLLVKSECWFVNDASQTWLTTTIFGPKNSCTKRLGLVQLGAASNPNSWREGTKIPGAAR